jgi:effector-binding domain-containing protein
MPKIGKPRIDTRPRQPYMGIRRITPFKGMSKEVDRLRIELNAWVNESQVETAGPPFLRFHVIDMRGFMDISYAVPVRKRLPAAGDIRAGELPAGRYASLVYSGGGISANRTLIEWVHVQGLEFDRRRTKQGDEFRGRCERYLTDPKVQPLKSKWKIEVAIKLAEK